MSDEKKGRGRPLSLSRVVDRIAQLEGILEKVPGWTEELAECKAKLQAMETPEFLAERKAKLEAELAKINARL